MTVAAMAWPTMTAHLHEGRPNALAGRPASLKSIADAGLPHWHVVIDCGCVVALLGACCAFIIVAADNLAHFGLFEQRWPLVCISVAIVSPLAFLRTMDSLRFTSLLQKPFLLLTI